LELKTLKIISGVITLRPHRRGRTADFQREGAASQLEGRKEVKQKSVKVIIIIIIIIIIILC